MLQIFFKKNYTERCVFLCNPIAPLNCRISKTLWKFSEVQQQKRSKEPKQAKKLDFSPVFGTPKGGGRLFPEPDSNTIR